jgi:hypothetical protein
MSKQDSEKDKDDDCICGMSSRDVVTMTALTPAAAIASTTVAPAVDLPRAGSSPEEPMSRPLIPDLTRLTPPPRA